MRRGALILSWCAVVMGLIHILFVFPLDNFRLNHLWFIGSGIAIILAGFINIIGITNETSKPTLALVLLSNIMLCSLFTIAAFVLQEPQVYIGVALFGSLAGLTVLNGRRNTSKGIRIDHGNA